MATVDLGWRNGDESLLASHVFSDDPPFAYGATVADRFVEFEATAGDIDGPSNHRELWTVAGSEGMEFARVLVGPRRAWFQSPVTPQHGAGLRYTESGGSRSAIVAWQNIFAGFWWTLNVGVWTAALDGSGFVNRQVNAQLTPLIHNVSVVGAGAARSGGVVTAPVAAGHRLRVGDPIVVDLANAAFDGRFVVSAVAADAVQWLQPGADDGTGGTGTIGHQFDYWLDLAVDPGTNIALVRAWKDLPGEPVPDFVALDTNAGPEWTGQAGRFASQPDTASTRLTGTITLISDVSMHDWTPLLIQSLISKFTTTNPSGQRAYRHRILQNGRVDFGWSTLGTSGLNLPTVNPLPAAGASERRAVASTFIPDDGAGNKRHRVYTAPTHKGPWELFEDVVSPGTTTIHAGTAPLEIGAVNNGALEPFSGHVHYAAVRSGDLAGTVVAEFVPQNYLDGATSWTDTTSGQVWTLADSLVNINSGIPAGAISAFAVDLDMAGAAAVRDANPTPSVPGGPAGFVVAHLGMNADSRDTYGWSRFADSVEALAGSPPSWPPGAGAVVTPRARWRRRRSRR